MARELTFSEKMAYLFKYGEARGIATTYRAIAEATRENANNIRKIYLGENPNPGIRTVRALADYFGVSLAYFDCATRTECQDYLTGAKPQQLRQDIAIRVDGLSETGLEAISKLIDYVRKAEELPACGPL
jgi:transcriptional regulator with XRE-family HTH domain